MGNRLMIPTKMMMVTSTKSRLAAPAWAAWTASRAAPGIDTGSAVGLGRGVGRLGVVELVEEGAQIPLGENSWPSAGDRSRRDPPHRRRPPCPRAWTGPLTVTVALPMKMPIRASLPVAPDGRAGVTVSVTRRAGSPRSTTIDERDPGVAPTVRCRSVAVVTARPSTETMTSPGMEPGAAGRVDAVGHGARTADATVVVGWD